ncbi:UTRA domain-containing protein [Nonomuraea wenchangensis]
MRRQHRPGHGLPASIGRTQARLVDEIQTRMPTKDESARLGLPAGTPVAEHMRTGHDAEGRPVRVMITVAAGDRHILVYELDAS